MRFLFVLILSLWPLLEAGAYETTLFPQTVYVGDQARLTVSLPASSSIDGDRASPGVIEVRDRLPRTKEVTILRVELDTRGAAPVVVIDFIPFVPGTLVLPPLEVGRVTLKDLQVQVASVLAGDTGSEPSPPEQPLAAPGTFPLLYLFAFLLLGILAAVALFVRKFLPFLRDRLERRRAGLAVRSMRRVLARLAEEVDGTSAGELLTVLFAELRSYLTYRTGINCYALTPGEFSAAFSGAVLPGAVGAEAVALGEEDLLFLSKLFRRGDEIRFGAAPVGSAELRAAVEGVSALVDRLESEGERC